MGAINQKKNTFSANNKIATVSVNREIIRIKEERKLMTRFVVASRLRPEIDLSYYLGNYEFSVVPRSLFLPDGSVLPVKDKSILVRKIEKLIEKNEECVHRVDSPSVIIFDGMAIAQKINIKKSLNIKTCKDYAAEYIRRVSMKFLLYLSAMSKHH